MVSGPVCYVRETRTCVSCVQLGSQLSVIVAAFVVSSTFLHDANVVVRSISFSWIHMSASRV